MTDSLAVGDVLVLTAGHMVHGGHCLSHADGHTVFLRGAMPGERVRGRVYRVRGSLGFAVTIDVLQPDPQRVEPPCAWFAGDGCGGCDWQFAPVAQQRVWKRDVLADAFRRQAGRSVAARVDWDNLTVEPLAPGAESGLGWRTRVRWRTTGNGLPGFRRASSHEVIATPNCRVLVPELQRAMTAHRAPPDCDVVAQAGRPERGAGHQVAVQVLDSRSAHAEAGSHGSAAPGAPRTTVQVGSRSWRTEPQAFWQAHAGLPTVLVDAVLVAGAPALGEHWWDLYSGVGLFSAFLGEAVGPTGSVQAVESSPVAARIARRNLHDLPQVRLHQCPVEDWLTAPSDVAPHGIVVDPPRRGLSDLTKQLSRHAPQRLIVVACDPVALARDAGLLDALGYRIQVLRAFDAFPMTHHFECIAVFTAADELS